MVSSMVSLLLASTVAAAGIESGTQLKYNGVIVAEKGDPVVTQKKFMLTVTVAGADDNGATLLWTLYEEGRGGWAWPDRFGRLDVDALGRGKAAAAPSLLYERPQGYSIVPLIAPLLAAEKPLTQGTEWMAGRLTHRVEAGGNVQDKPVWRVTAGNLYGTKRTLWVDKSSPIVRRLQENVFIGQGEKHDLRYELVEQAMLSDEQLAGVENGFDQMIRLRDQLEHEPRSVRVNWSDQQLAALKAAMPEVLKATAKTPLAEIALSAERDSKDQKDRLSAVGALAKAAVGTKLNGIEIEAVRGEALTAANLEDKVTVFHFWAYRDTPLEEPYGQVAYLDFLYRNKKSDKLQVYGVAVDERLADARSRGKAIAGAKKLKSFMNLSYPLLLDAGRTIKKIGDPRAAEAELPLFVVVDSAGNIVHYHVGFYEVDRDRGLKELDDVVNDALRKAG